MKLLDKYRGFLLGFFLPLLSPSKLHINKSPTLIHPFFNVWILAIRLLSKKEQKKIMQIISIWVRVEVSDKHLLCSHGKDRVNVSSFTLHIPC
jgi:hypothetical protein